MASDTAVKLFNQFEALLTETSMRPEDLMPVYADGRTRYLGVE